MGETEQHRGSERWGLRSVPEDLARRYAAEGWWTDATLGAMVADGLAGMGREVFEVHSRSRPWRGTFADVDRAARSLAAALRARGVGPGVVVVIQLPNWLEAGITFWAAAYLGAVVVPVVHFYGAKEVEYILAGHRARRGGDGRPVRPQRLPGHLRRPAGPSIRSPCGWWWGRPPPQACPPRRRPFESLLDADPLAGPAEVDPDAPAIIGFTSGTTRDPKGVVHSHRTIGCETRQLDHLFPEGRPTPDHRVPGGPLHRHAQRLPGAAPAGAARSTCSTSGIRARCCA